MAGGVLLTNTSTSLRKRDTAFSIADTSTVTRIFLADKQGRTVTLTKKPGYWDLNGKYEAHEDNVRMLLNTMQKVRVMEPVSNASRNTVIKLLAAGGTKVEIYQMKPRISLGALQLFPREKCTKTYYVGTHTQDNLGTYMLMEGAEDPYITYIPGFRGFIASRYHAREIDWRKHLIFSTRLPQIQSLSVSFPALPEESYKITALQDHQYKITELLHQKEITDFNKEKVIALLTSFERINFEAFITHYTPHEVDSIIHQEPYFILTLTDKAGKETTLRSYRRPALKGQKEFIGEEITYDVDKLYAIVNEEKELLLIQHYVFDKITRRLSYLKQ
ncbi:MAG: hypothetical protein CSA04_04295 [Bacteroidetes bacterium]|nr:MAG: hypothetical protein CSA04_04295 [Bacteroidota bacterium]